MKPADIIKAAQDRLAACEEYYSEEYRRAEDDEKFVYGEQWDDYAKKVREGRPCLVENRLLPFKHQVLNSIKQADLSITVSPVDDEGDPETAEIFQGIIRNIEVRSNASVAYATGADKAISGGRGFIRINTKYADYKSFDKDIWIERVINPKSVYIDPASIEMDGSDAEFAIIFDDIPRDKFESEYPDADPMPFEAKDDCKWNTKDTVRIAEYFWKEYKKKTIYLLADGTVTDEPGEGEVVDQRISVECTVKWAKLSAEDVLEETEIEGEYIPIVPVYGEEAWLEGRRKLFSLIHQAKDPQRALNYWVSADTEVMALQPKVPYIGAVGSFDSKNMQWLTANSKNPAFLEYDPVYGENGQLLPPPMREQAPASSPGMMQAIMRNAEAIKASLGMFDPSLGRHGNEAVSGVALREGKLQGDNANFHFIDNLAISIRHVGRILVGMIPKVYSGPRIMRIIGKDGQKQIVPINQPYVKTEEGIAPLTPDMIGARASGIYDLNAGKYDVVVDVDASYATKRQEMVQTILTISQAKPEILEVAGDILVKNLDIPDAEDLVKRIQATMDPALLGDDPQAAKLQEAAEAMKVLQEQLLSMQIKLDEKVNNQQFENELKIKQLDSENTQFEITSRQKDKELEIKAIEAAAKVQKEAPLPPEVLGEVALTLDELLETTADLQDAVGTIISAKESEATSQPRGLLSRLMGRNS